MKTELFFLICLSIAVFAYSDPPHSEVNANNDAIAPGLLDSNCMKKNTTTYSNPIGCAEAELITVYPSVDNRISSDENTRALWRYAYYASDESDSYTDDHGCTSYYSKTFQNFSISSNISIITHNSTFTMQNISQNPVLLNQSFLSAHIGEKANISFSAIMQFKYHFSRTISYWMCIEQTCQCYEDLYPTEDLFYIRYATNNLDYEVEGGSPIYLMTKPVLGEQWIPNAQFESLVFSNNKFYKAFLS
ncbi:hypothetical protein KJ780_01740, partial [Candidatus Micrarchaeota archaeon]|nr:hypothetical protein [Candidatus Micrarchaeota archaeon]